MNTSFSFTLIWNHQPFVSIQKYDSAVESVIYFTFNCDAPQNVAFTPTGSNFPYFLTLQNKRVAIQHQFPFPT